MMAYTSRPGGLVAVPFVRVLGDYRNAKSSMMMMIEILSTFQYGSKLDVHYSKTLPIHSSTFLINVK